MEHSSKALRRFNHLFCETNAAYHEASAQLGLSDSVMQVLYTVCDYSDEYRCPLHEICIRTGISKQTINSALRKLEAEGAVYLEQAGAKHKDVYLTEQGILLAKKTALQIVAAENAVFASWTEEEVEAYLSLAEKYLLAFRAETKHIKRSES